MRKFEVEVIRTDKYVVTIDADNLEEDLIEDFKITIHSLGEDNLKNSAEYIAADAMNNNIEFYE